jgi:hypothetical protein
MEGSDLWPSSVYNTALRPVYSISPIVNFSISYTVHNFHQIHSLCLHHDLSTPPYLRRTSHGWLPPNEDAQPLLVLA